VNFGIPEGMFTPSFIPGGEHSLLLRKMEGQIEDLHAQGITSSLQVHHFTPRDEIKN
jgi:hypothetical protein